MGDAIGRQAASEGDSSRREAFYTDAVDNYLRFLSMTDFSAPVRERVVNILLGNVYRDLFNQCNARDYLLSARSNYAKMIELNPNLEYAHNARDYIQQIDRRVSQLK